jgi:hypothetical protein
MIRILNETLEFFICLLSLIHQNLTGILSITVNSEVNVENTFCNRYITGLRQTVLTIWT